MEFYYFRFAIELGIWLCFADKKRWRELIPVCFLASLLGAITDTIMHHHKFWDYDDGCSAIPYILNDFGTYVVVTYLFIQYLPKERTPGAMVWYWVKWTAASIGIEWVHVHTGHLRYFRGWNMVWSYVSDWILFWIFYKYHQIFQFEKLTSSQKD